MAGLVYPKSKTEPMSFNDTSLKCMHSCRSYLLANYQVSLL